MTIEIAKCLSPNPDESFSYSFSEHFSLSLSTITVASIFSPILSSNAAPPIQDGKIPPSFFLGKVPNASDACNIILTTYKLHLL